jgi:hypothetical protein
MQVLGRRQVRRLELAAMDDEDLMACRHQFLDGRAPDEAGAAEDGYTQRVGITP